MEPVAQLIITTSYRPPPPPHLPRHPHPPLFISSLHWHRNIWLPCCPKERWWIPGMIFMKWPVLPEWEQLLNMRGWKINEAEPLRERPLFIYFFVVVVFCFFFPPWATRFTAAHLHESCNCGKEENTERALSLEVEAAPPPRWTSRRVTSQLGSARFCNPLVQTPHSSPSCAFKAGASRFKAMHLRVTRQRLVRRCNADARS